MTSQTVTVIDGDDTYEGVEVGNPERALAVVRPEPPAGLSAVAALSDEEFEANLIVIRKGVERARRMHEALLVEGTDYGTVQGIPRPFLQKPGAEKFEKAYRLATTFEVERLVGDGEATPALEFIVHAKVHVGDATGPVVGEGVGEASSFERKYRYRSGGRVCPECGQPAIRRGTRRGTDEPEFYCWNKPDRGSNGCGKRFAIDDPRLSQSVDEVENPDPWDLANTLLKMATKRAHVDAILRATGTSGLFTQDEDSPAVSRPSGPPVGAQRASQAPAEGPKPPYSLGRQSITGRLLLSNQSDGDPRPGPDGSVLAFLVEYLDADGRHKVQAIAKGALAEDIHDASEGSLRKFVQTEVTVEGELWMTPWNDANGRAMPPKRSMDLAAIATSEWELPVPDVEGPLSLDEVVGAVDA